MPTSTHVLNLPGAMVRRGFWLYVWRIASPGGELLYVGRTGDSSSAKASTPFARMAQHLGTNRQQNMVRRHMERRNVRPEDCSSFALVAYGPLFPEVRDWTVHKKRRDKVAALERELADRLRCVGYDVLNTVRDTHDLDAGLWGEVRKEFARYFERLGCARH